MKYVIGINCNIETTVTLTGGNIGGKIIFLLIKNPPYHYRCLIVLNKN